VKVQPVDTTAAGDTFVGALTVALAQGKPLLAAAREAQCAAALAVTRVGAQTSIPTRAELQQFIESRGGRAALGLDG
jgi:ribokinase